MKGEVMTLGKINNHDGRIATITNENNHQITGIYYGQIDDKYFLFVTSGKRHPVYHHLLIAKWRIE